MLIKSALATQISGSIGGMTGSHNRGGMYLRGRSIPVNPTTIPQVVVRNQFASLAAYWNNTLSPAQRTSWNIYALNVGVVNPLGSTVQNSGFNWFMAVNTLRVQAPLAIAPTAPSGFTMATISPIGITSLTAATGIAIVTFTNTDPWASASTGALMMWGSRPQNPAVNYFDGPYRYVGRINGAGTPPTSPQNMPAWPFPLVAGQRVFGYVRAVDPSTSPKISTPVKFTVLAV